MSQVGKMEEPESYQSFDFTPHSGSLPAKSFCILSVEDEVFIQKQVQGIQNDLLLLRTSEAGQSACRGHHKL